MEPSATRHSSIKSTGESSIDEPMLHLSGTTLFRILDANLDRAREGMRVLEEWCRFGLNNEAMTARFKHLRQSIAQWHTVEIRLTRDTPGDLGTALTHPQEEVRESLINVLQANFARVQEALRVLEEYGKLYSAEMSAACKQMRYELYTLDSQVLDDLLKAQSFSSHSLSSQPFSPQSLSSESFIARSDPSNTVLYKELSVPATPAFQERYERLLRSHTYLVTSPVPDLLGTVELALKGGIAIVQYREKTANDDERLKIAKEMRSLCHQYDALFIVNDRVDIAAAADADGVHLGQQDLPMEAARQILGPDKIIGRSTTNPSELERALNEKADYIGVGPVHATPTKPGKAASGDEYVRYAAQHATMPWFAIGGLNADNLAPTLEAGATRIAIVRAIMQADDPTAIAQSLVEQTKQQ